MAFSMQGSVVLTSDPDTVWKALNDPDILLASLPGCQSVEKVGDSSFTAVVKVKVGPINATFKGAVELSDLSGPHSYRISGSGNGGMAGNARGGADVVLVAIPEGTELSYTVDAVIGGKIAQLGSRLIDGVAKRLADQFFANFAEVTAHR